MSLFNPYQKQYTCRYSECKTKLEDVVSDTAVQTLKVTLEALDKETKELQKKLNEIPHKKNSAEKRYT